MTNQLILLLIIIAVIYLLLERTKNRSDPVLPPPVPPSSKNLHWNHLHPDFDSSVYVNLWQSHGYDYHSAEKWIKGGITPGELGFVKWIKAVKRLDPEYITKSELNPLRREWQRSKTGDGGIEFFH